jgi:hypothetical protein
MKLAISILLCLVLAAGPAFSQKKYLKQFQREYRGETETLRIGLGFWIKVGGAVIPAHLIGDEDVTTVKRLLKKVSRLKVYMISAKDSGTIDNMAIHRLKQTLIDKVHMEPLLEVRDQGSTVYMLNKGKGDELGDVVVLIKDGGDLVMMDLHSRLHMSDIQDLLNRYVANK